MPLFDKKDKSRYATFTRRSLALSGGMTLVFAVLAGRLYQLQIRDGDEYKEEAEDNRISERLIAPPRGRILDRFGVELANNLRNYRVLLVAEQASEGVSEALDNLSKVIQIGDLQKKRILQTIAENKKFVPVPGRNSPASTCICLTCPGCSPMSARRAIIPMATPWCIFWAMSLRSRRKT
jgi:penicillin-binding protein 2